MVFFIPADGQQDPSEITNFLDVIRDCDIVCGYREKRIDRFYRRLNAKLWNFWIRLFFGLKVKDLNWVKMYRAEVFKKIELVGDSAFIDSEVLIKANKRGFRIKEIPTGHFPRETGRQTGSHPLVILRAFRDFFRLYKIIRNE